MIGVTLPEDKLKELEELENKFKEDHPEDVYLRNILPFRKVDYIFIGTEPSLKRWTIRSNDEERKKDADEKIRDGFKNFIFSAEDFILKYAIENYLKLPYYITDISKIALPTDEIDKNKYWKNGLTILKKEIALYSNEKTKIISIGRIQVPFLIREGILSNEKDCLWHFSSQNSVRRNKYAIDNNDKYEEFIKRIPLIEHILIFAENYLSKNCMAQTGIIRELCLKSLKKARSKNNELSDAKKKLLFYLFNEFHEFQKE